MQLRHRGSQTFNHTGNVTGHHVGPPSNAFATRPGMASSQPIGSGVATQQIAPTAPTASSLPVETVPAGAPGATLGTPTAMAQASPMARPEAAIAAAPAAPPKSNAQTVATPSALDSAFGQKPPARARQTASASSGQSILAPEQTAVASELPGIRVVTHGPRSVIIRQIHDFEIRVENRGSIDASGVMVRAVVPDWAEVRGQKASRGKVESQMIETSDRLVWTIDSLPAGSQETMVVKLQALRSGTHPVDVDWTLIPQKSVAQIEVREPKLDLLIEGPESVVYGESQTYKVRVLNPGDGIAPNVVFTLSPNSATPQTQRIGDIPSGKEAQFEVELTAQDLGDLKIHGLAHGDLQLKAEASKTIQVSAAELESVLTGPETKYQDTKGVYHLEITNNGTAASKEITATLLLPTGVEYIGGIAIAKMRGQKLTWPIVSLPPGASREFQIECSMKSPGKKVFEFQAEGSAAGETKVALDTQVESISDLVMTIQDPVAPAPVGSEVVYQIAIKNRGSRDATAVQAIAQFSHGIEPRRIEGHTGQVLTGQVLLDPIDRIAAGQQVTIRIVAEAETAGHHRFRTEIRSGETVLVAEEATHYMTQRSERVSRRSSSSVIR